MKKYLTMVLAIAISGVFVGCHEDELSGSLIEQKKIAFEDAFIQAFGQPDPNHNWGFRMPDTESLTRTADPRGNMWEDEGWNVPPVITDAQKNIVRQYFQQNTPIGYNDPRWTDFWIQQVYKGGTKAKGSGDDNSKTSETYTIGNGDAVVGGNHMDHLCSKSANGTEDHIYDFNNSDNNDWEGRMLMRGSSTYSFGYINSNATAIHYDKAALVNWRVIAQWAVDNGLESSVESSVLNDKWNRSYMGFDWEQALPENCYSANTFTFDGKTYHFLIANANQYAYDQTETTFGGKQNYNDRPSDATIRQLLSLGYLPYSDTLKDWIKLSTGADGYYSDWIVTLTQATNSTVAPSVKQVSETSGGYYIIVRNVEESGRVMCEDLAGASGNLDDLDYNDIVFDAIIVHEYKLPTLADGTPTGGAAFDDKYYATVRLMAAGGTIPVEMVIPEESGDQNFDVHSLLGAGDNVMINTLHEADRSKVNGAAVKEDAEPVTLKNKKDDTDKFYGVRYIKDITLNVLYNRVSTTLENSGAAPLKFLVPLGTKWAKERTIISSAYPDFTSWVKDQYYNDNCFANNVPDNLYDDFVGLSETGIVNSDPIYIEGSESYSKTSVTATSAMAYPGASEKTIYNFAAQNADPGYLCPAVGSETEEYLNVTLSDDDKASIAVDQVIRIYGVYIAGWYVTTNISGTESFASFSANGNYIDIPVTSGNIDQIKSNIAIRGKHFTVTYVTIVGANSNTPTQSDNQGTNEGGNGDEVSPAKGAIWSGEEALDYSLKITISKDEFKNATSTSKLRFTAAHDGNHAQIWIKKKKNQWEVEDIVQVYASNDWPGSTTFTIDNYLSVLQSNDICIQGGGLTLTKIELIP